MFSLEGKVAMVTGARGGIGRALAVGLAGAGAGLVLHGHHDDLDETADLVADAGGEVVGRWSADFLDPPSLLAPLDAVLAEHRVDVLVNNAGVIVREPAAELGYPQWRSLLDVDLDALWLCTQRVGRTMLKRRAGKVVSIASLLAFRGGSERVAYAAPKHAVAGLTRALSNAWAPANIQVNAIAPGYIATERPSPAIGDAALLARIPAGRWGNPADLVGAAVFLASAAADYVTGHVLPVDGGFLAS